MPIEEAPHPHCRFVARRTDTPREDPRALEMEPNGLRVVFEPVQPFPRIGENTRQGRVFGDVLLELDVCLQRRPRQLLVSSCRRCGIEPLVRTRPCGVTLRSRGREDIDALPCQPNSLLGGRSRELLEAREQPEAQSEFQSVCLVASKSFHHVGEARYRECSLSTEHQERCPVDLQVEPEGARRRRGREGRRSFDLLLGALRGVGHLLERRAPTRLVQSFQLVGFAICAGGLPDPPRDAQSGNAAGQDRVVWCHARRGIPEFLGLFEVPGVLEVVRQLARENPDADPEDGVCLGRVAGEVPQQALRRDQRREGVESCELALGLLERCRSRRTVQWSGHPGRRTVRRRPSTSRNRKHRDA